jgi:deazaflavin-dependent oxidoreductase (nitroreductase family)
MDEKTSTDIPDLSQMPNDWWRGVQQQAVEQVRKTGTTAGLPADGPVIVVTMTGAKTGLPRPVPLLRIQHEGSYVIVASKAGASREPVWAGNVRANPNVAVQDREVTRSFTAREVTGSEREIWWERAVAAQPAESGYAAKTDRVFPLFVLDPA